MTRIPSLTIMGFYFLLLALASVWVQTTTLAWFAFIFAILGMFAITIAIGGIRHDE